MIGFNKYHLPYTPGVRIAGETKYSLKKMIDLALNASFFFLRTTAIHFYILRIFLLLCLLTGFVLLTQHSLQGSGFGGFETVLLAAVIFLCTSSVLFSLGILGILMRYTLQGVSKRPPYIIKRVVGLDNYIEE